LYTYDLLYVDWILMKGIIMSFSEHSKILRYLLNLLLQSDINDTLDKSCMSTASSKNNTTSTSLGPLLTSSVIDEENADSILEEHCSRIWERSAQQTPSRSPGRHSPRSKSPDRFRKSLSQSHPHSGTSSMPTTLHSKQLHKKRDFYSTSSFDSGMVEDLNKCSVETHKHIHHHHHHHHERGRKSKHKLEQQAQQHSMMCWGDGTPRPHSSSGTRQKTGSRTHSDSGISMVESIGQTQADVSMSDPSRTK
jgi:hypothetical protein